MKKMLLVIVLLLSTNIYSQITIMKAEIQKPEHNNFVYDSLKNMSPEKYNDRYTYHHLIGQTLMYCGNPYSYRAEANFKIGSYYRVDGILPDDTGKGLYHRLSLTDIDTGDKYEEGDIFTEKYNFKWVILGHYEKMKSLYVNKEFVYFSNKSYTGYDKQDHIINLATDTITKNIKEETVWTCVDVQVKQRVKDDRMDIDNRSPIVLIFDNPQYGKHYCYLETKMGKPFENYNKEEAPLVCGKFQLKSYYDKTKSLNIAANNKRKADLTRKYGATNANKILRGIVVTGWSKAMCVESWGEPSDINKTSGSFGVHEQWVYSDGTYLYFENGKLTTIQE